MKKILGTLAVASFACIPVAQADVVGFEIGAYQWKPDYNGTIISSTDTIAGTEIDLQDDLGYSDDSNNIFWVALEHPIPVLPNIMITTSDLETSASSVLSQDIVFNGETFTVSEDVFSVIDLSNTEYTLYYEILDNWVNFDLGLTIREYDGLLALQTDPAGSNLNEQEDVDYTIPLLYLNGRFDLPFTGWFVDATINYTGYDDDSVSDLMVALGYESAVGFGASAGYRQNKIDVEEDGFTVDGDFDGAYFSVFFHF